MYYGDLGKRIIAMIIDSIVLSMVGFISGFTFGYFGIIIAPIISWTYYILMEGSSWHATLGKKVMGLCIVDSNGNGITYSTSILRLMGKILSGLILGIGYLMAFFNDQKQGLHDMIAKTYVLNEQAHISYAGGRYSENPNQKANANAYGRLPELVGINGPLAGMVYQISGNGLIIGRDSISCQVVLPASQASVSRIHCYLTYNQMSGMFVLNDRNSTHGTYLANGSRVSYAQPVALKSGDRFYLGTPGNTFEVR